MSKTENKLQLGRIDVDNANINNIVGMKCKIHDNDIMEIKSNVKEILRLLNGNGKIGLCAKISILWSGSIFLLTVIIATAIKAFAG